MTSMIATFDIRKAKDEAGNVLEPQTSFENAVFRYVIYRTLAQV